MKTDRLRKAATDRTRILWGVVIVLALVVFFIGPERAALSAMGSDRHRAAVLGAEGVKWQQQVTEGRRVRLSMTHERSTAQSDATAIPMSDDSPGLLSAIDQAAAGDGVSIQSISDVVTTPTNNAAPTAAERAQGTVGQRVEGQQLGSVAVSVEASGTLSALESFLGSVESLPRLVVVSSVAVAEGGQTQAGQYTVTLSGVAYYADVPVPTLAKTG